MSAGEECTAVSIIKFRLIKAEKSNASQGCQITAFLRPNRSQVNKENKSQVQRKTKSIVEDLASKMQ